MNPQAQKPRYVMVEIPSRSSSPSDDSSIPTTSDDDGTRVRVRYRYRVHEREESSPSLEYGEANNMTPDLQEGRRGPPVSPPRPGAARNRSPAAGPGFQEPPTYGQARSSFWHQLDQFEKKERSLVSVRKPQKPEAKHPMVPSSIDAKPLTREGLEPSPPPGGTTSRNSRMTLAGETLVACDSLSEGSAAAVRPRRVDLVHDPSQEARDMTVRLELDVDHDWELDLEEFCRLRRLGRFKEAKDLFQSRLDHVATRPYIRVQYAEMLLASGDYTNLQALEFLPELAPTRSAETPEERNLGKLASNYALVDLLSQRPIPDYVAGAWRVVRNTLDALGTETTIGSTEVQLLVLCLRVLRYLETCLYEDSLAPAKVYAKCLFDWGQLYYDLVGESYVWDFKDLFLAAVSLFGWQGASSQFFSTTHPPRVVDVIVKDWSRPNYEEASVMGILDLFTSLILQDFSDNMRSRNSLLLEHAGTLAESVEQNDRELMRSRPFIQWLLAKSVLETQAPPERPDGVQLGDFTGLKLDPGCGIHLPIYVPSRHSSKPDWDMFFSRATPAQQRVIQVAAGAAADIGDFTLQAEALKLLILQSQDPKSYMRTLAHLQLETQGDREGYLATCLSKYLVATSPSEEAALLRDLEKPDGTSSRLFFEQCQNASLTWAWSMIRLLLSSANGDGASTVANDRGLSGLLKQDTSMDGSKLPSYIRDFVRSELDIVLSPPMGMLALTGAKPAGTEGGQEQNQNKIEAEQHLANRLNRGVLNPGAQPDHAKSGYANALAMDPRMDSYYPGMVYTPVPPQPPYYPPRAYLDYPAEPLAQGISPYLEVNGWPSTWHEDAKRYGCTPETPEDAGDKGRGRYGGRNRRPSFLGAQGPQRVGDEEAGRDDVPKSDKKEANKDKKKASYDGKSASQGQDDPSQPPKSSNGDPAKGKAKNNRTKRIEIIEEIEKLYQDGDNGPEQDKAQQGDGHSDDRPQMSVEEGVTRLNFATGVLDNNAMTVLLQNKNDVHKSKAYVVDKGGVFETIVSFPGRRPAGGDDDDEAAEAPEQGDESELNVRTRSVKFDTASSSSSSTARERPRKHQKRKDKGKESNGPARDAGRSDAKEAAATLQHSASDDPWDQFREFSAQLKTIRLPKMSGARQAGEDSSCGDTTTKGDGKSLDGDGVTEEVQAKEREGEGGDDDPEGDSMPPVAPSPPDPLAPSRPSPDKLGAVATKDTVELSPESVDREGGDGDGKPTSPGSKSGARQTEKRAQDDVYVEEMGDDVAHVGACYEHPGPMP